MLVGSAHDFNTSDDFYNPDDSDTSDDGDTSDHLDATDDLCTTDDRCTCPGCAVPRPGVTSETERNGYWASDSEWTPVCSRPYIRSLFRDLAFRRVQPRTQMEATYRDR
jgi:hypothetical protein